MTEEELNCLQIEARTEIVVFQEFSGPCFETLRKKGTRLRIYGPPIIIELAASVTPGSLPSWPTPKSGYPIFSRLLRNCKICATGIKTREELVSDLGSLIEDLKV